MRTHFRFPPDQKFFMASVKSTHWKRYCLLIKSIAVIVDSFAYQLSAPFFFYPVFIILLSVKFSFRSLSSSVAVAIMVSPKTRQSSVIKMGKLNITKYERETILVEAQKGSSFQFLAKITLQIFFRICKASVK